jgi:hypothetical protein
LMIKSALDFVKFVLPPVEPSHNNVQRFYNDVYGSVDLGYPYDFENEINVLKKMVPETTPKYKEYIQIMEKYGYVFPRDPIEILFTKYHGYEITEELRMNLKKELQIQKLYNPFKKLASYSPASTSKLFEKLLIDLSKEYSKHEIIPPITLENTPSVRYDAYVPDTNKRIEVKVTRLIDKKKTENSMHLRFGPYGTSMTPKVNFEQVKLKYFDVFVGVFVSTNIALWTVLTEKNIEKLVMENYVNKENKKPGITVSIMHNTKKSPRTPEERLNVVMEHELQIQINGEPGIKSFIEYADVATFDVREVLKFIDTL